MLTLEKIEKVYRTEKVETVALQNINLRLDPGEFISIMGPSGSGKSTLLNIMGLLDVSTGGRLSLEGREVTSFSDRDLARLRNEKFGFVFQTFHLINDLSVVDNVEIPLLYRRMAGSERRRLSLQALDRVGLTSRAYHFPSQLSGGQQQRVAIARALVNDPSIVLADEPTGNLDTRTSVEVMEIFQRLNAETGMTVVLITHEPDIAEYGTRVVSMRDGLIVSDRKTTSRRIAEQEL